MDTPDPVNGNGPDFGYKNVHVRVSWSSGGATYSYDTEALVSR